MEEFDIHLINQKMVEVAGLQAARHRLWGEIGELQKKMNGLKERDRALEAQLAEEREKLNKLLRAQGVF